MNEVRFYLSRLVRHTHWITLLVIIGSAIGFGFTVLPQNFVGQARLLIEPQQISDELAPQTASLQTADQVDLIRQRVLRRQTVLDLALIAIGAHINEVDYYESTHVAKAQLASVSIAPFGGPVVPEV